MFNRLSTQAASFFFAVAITASTLAGIDALAVQGSGVSAEPVQQVVVTAKRLPRA